MGTPDPYDHRKHPKSAELYTPITPEVMMLLERMKREHGTWREVAAITHTRLKTLRNLRRGNRKSVTYWKLDQLCTATGVGSVHEFTWFTADDMVALGIWDPVQHVEGLARIQGGNVRFTSPEQMEEEKRQAQLEAARKLKRQKRRDKLIRRNQRRMWRFPT